MTWYWCLAGIVTSACQSTKKVSKAQESTQMHIRLTLLEGYSGVAIYTRQSVCVPIRAEEGVIGVLSPPNSQTQYRDLPKDQQIGGYLTEEQISGLIPASITDDSKRIDAAALDSEGRCVVLEFPAFVLFGVYSPANSNGMRDDFRYAFLTALDARIRNLDTMGKRVILTGDLNVSRSEIETASAEEDIRKMCISHAEYVSTPNRRVFNQLVEGGPVAGSRDPGRKDPVLWDICREFHPDRKGMYTHWEQKINARPGNYGSRIDYVLCSIGMKAWFCKADIQEGLMVCTCAEFSLELHQLTGSLGLRPLPCLRRFKRRD